MTQFHSRGCSSILFDFFVEYSGKIHFLLEVNDSHRKPKHQFTQNVTESRTIYILFSYFIWCIHLRILAIIAPLMDGSNRFICFNNNASHIFYMDEKPTNEHVNDWSFVCVCGWFSLSHWIHCPCAGSNLLLLLTAYAPFQCSIFQNAINEWFVDAIFPAAQ